MMSVDEARKARPRTHDRKLAQVAAVVDNLVDAEGVDRRRDLQYKITSLHAYAIFDILLRA